MNGDFEPNETLAHLYPEAHVGGFSRTDGQIEFYTRINALVDESSVVLDFGAGRAEWMFNPMPAMSRKLRLLKGRVAKVVGVDAAEAVLTNPTVDEALVVPYGDTLPFADETFDLIIADHVLEHIAHEDAAAAAADWMRVLKPGGWLAARTPNKWGMIGIGARAVPNRMHVSTLKHLQPDRLAEDVFPVVYAMNTRKHLRRHFPAPAHRVFVYGHTSEPTYFGTSVTMWRLATLINRLTPPRMAPTLMVFIQKQPGS